MIKNFDRLGSGIDPLKYHKELAKATGHSDDYIKLADQTGHTIPEEIYDKLEKQGMEEKKVKLDTPRKRSIEGSTQFSMVNPEVSDINIEEYKASVHSPTLSKIPSNADRRK